MFSVVSGHASTHGRKTAKKLAVHALTCKESIRLYTGTPVSAARMGKRYTLPRIRIALIHVSEPLQSLDCHRNASTVKKSECFVISPPKAAAAATPSTA